MVFEVPDCRKTLDGQDHCFLWEEHISYFTPVTLRAFFEYAGFKDIEIKIYPYPMEDSLVAIIRNIRSEPKKATNGLDDEIVRLENFANTLETRGRRIKQYLHTLQAQGHSIALFGAGHLAAKYINFYDLSSCLYCVVDDNSDKVGRLMPGSRLGIVDSGCLDAGKVDLCLLTLNPESARRVMKKKEADLAQGGKFRSIFSASDNSIDQDILDD